MIYEFALDPNVIIDWNSFRFFIDQFGPSKGRLISRFPKKWKRMVYEALVEKKPSDLDRTRIEVRLKSIDDRLLSNSRDYSPELPWVTNAVNQHSVKPFRAIITSGKNAEPYLLTADEVDETNPHWRILTSRSVMRTADAMAEVVRPLLEISSEIIFVDPYFDPEKRRFRRPLERFLDAISTGTTKRIEMHFRDHDNTPFFDDQFKQTCESKLAGILPVGLELRLVRWREREGGKRFHDRYILTNIGGLLFPTGLDDDDGDGGQQATINLLTQELHCEFWKDFQAPDDLTVSTYEFDNEYVVIGTKVNL